MPTNKVIFFVNIIFNYDYYLRYGFEVFVAQNFAMFMVNQQKERNATIILILRKTHMTHNFVQLIRNLWH